jgi:hypothetical protein
MDIGDRKGAYCDSLIRPLRASVAPGAQIELRAAPVRATPEVALPFGLIVADAGLVRPGPVLRRHWSLGADAVRTGIFLRERRGLYGARCDGRSRYGNYFILLKRYIISYKENDFFYFFRSSNQVFPGIVR